MRKVKITLPATITNLGPGLNSLGLAIGLYTTVEITERGDEQLLVETEGEGAGRYGLGLQHPVVLALMRIFQNQERAVLGLSVKVTNHIPLNSGLGAEAAFTVAGVMGANNLLSTPYSRAQVLELAAQISGRPDHTVAAVLGGLTASLLSGGTLIHRALPTGALTVIVTVPELENYGRDAAQAKPDRVALTDALFNVSRVPLLVDALRLGDLKLAGQMLDDRLYTPYLKTHIAGYDHVAEMARRAGALAVSLSGDGPAVVAFAAADHRKIGITMELAFENAGVKARSWVAPVDTQGVVVSVAQSA
jgi:homoserine kinase